MNYDQCVFKCTWSITFTNKTINNKCSGEELGSREASTGCFPPGGGRGLKGGQYGRLKTGSEEEGSLEASMGG